MEWLDREKSGNNVVVNGTEINSNYPMILRGIMNSFKERLKVEVQIKMAYKLGETTCLVELSDHQDK